MTTDDKTAPTYDEAHAKLVADGVPAEDAHQMLKAPGSPFEATRRLVVRLDIPAMPESRVVQFMDCLRELGEVYEEATAQAESAAAPPKFDAYGNPYGNSSPAKPTHDKYGNPYTPGDKPASAPRGGVGPDGVRTHDNYGNPLNPTPSAPAPNLSAPAPTKDEKGRPTVDKYGNPYNGKF